MADVPTPHSDCTPFTPLQRLQVLRKEALERAAELHDEFFAIVRDVLGKSLDEDNPQAVEEVRVLLGLLGIECFDAETGAPAHFRSKAANGTLGGVIELRYTHGGKRQFLNSRTKFPDELHLRSAHASGDDAKVVRL